MFEEHEGIRYLEIRERGPKKLVLSTASISENISKQSDSNNRNIYFAHRSIHEPHHSPLLCTMKTPLSWDLLNPITVSSSFHLRLLCSYWGHIPGGCFCDYLDARSTS